MSWTDLAKQGRILVVDDAVDNIQILHQALQDEHTILCATNGERALEIAAHQCPDLILLDAVMPEMDGFAVLKALRAAPLTREIPVIFVTALHTPEAETHALEAGAADFITKPLNIAVVRARVRTQLTVKRQADMLRALTLTDSLTGAANRRAFDEALAHEWRRAARARTPVSLILLDIDHFKLYNDEYGHQAGDACLQQIAGSMSRAAGRPQDLVARYGGEEFVILLPGDPIAGAEAVAAKVIEEVAELALPHARSPGAQRVTVSMGVASVHPTDKDAPADLVKLADSLLYRAKAAGRNHFISNRQS